MAICYGITKDGSIITVEYSASDGEVGTSFDNPYTMDDVYDTAVENEWDDIVQRTYSEGSFYYFPYTLALRGTDTYFYMKGISILFDTPEDYAIDLYESNIFIEEDVKRPANIFSCAMKNQGNYMRWYNTTDCSVIVQDSTFNYFYNNYIYGNVIWRRVTLRGQNYNFLARAAGPILEDYNCYNSFYGGLIENNFTSANRLNMINCTYGLVVGYGDFSISNLNVINCDYDIRIVSNGYKGDMILIDGDLDISNYAAIYVNDGSANIYQKTTFNTLIEDSSGGNLTIEDNNGNVLYTELLSSDSMTEQTIINKYLFYVGADDEVDVSLYDYTPFTVKVSKSGYQDLEISNISVTQGKPTLVYGYMKLPNYRVVTFS